MTEIPDKVIEEAAKAGNRAFKAAPINALEGADQAFARVIARWAREQERAEIREEFGPALEDAADLIRGEWGYPGWEGNAGHKACSDLYSLLAALDREDEQ